jgi:TPP-dependent pyruvate/acetoin dehydrogenase alpha subunit
MNKKQCLEAYRRMLVIRLFEETVERLFSRGLIQGTAHPAIGQEAVAVGACGALRPGRDCVTSTHRGHGHCLACGGDPNRAMAELFGKATGYSRGRGGSQLMADFSLGFLGSNGITGAGLPVAAGAALAFQLRRAARVALCFFGDGAANQGVFHEALNLAAIWKLPVVYVCENNRYAMSMPVEKSIAIRDIADRATAYGMPGLIVDGNDLEEVRGAVRAAAERARRAEGPTLIECKTYRLSGHSRGDPRRYRSREEEAQWRRKDPIAAWRRTLRARGLLTTEDDRRIRHAARAAIREAVAFARRSPPPDAQTLEEGLFS